MNINNFNEAIKNFNLKAGDRVKVEIDQDLYKDHIIYLEVTLSNCDLMKGIESNFLKGKEIELVNETSDFYGDVIDVDALLKLLNCKSGKIRLRDIRRVVDKL